MAICRLVIFGSALAGLLAACGEAPPPRAKPFSQDAGPDGDGAADHGDDGDGADDGETGGEGDGAGDSGGLDDGSLDDLFRKCRIDPDEPAKQLLDMRFAGLPVTQTGTETIVILPITWTATIVPTLAITSSMLQSVATTTVSVTVDPSLAQARGDEEAKRRSGPITTELMPLDARVNLGDTAPAWDGMGCTVPAATKVTVQTGAGTAVTTFAPALPSSVSPLPEAERYDAELAAPRTFPGIVATVVQSMEPSVPVGSKYTGTVTVREIDPAYDVIQQDGSTVTVGGDRGFEVTANFGTPKITAALGVKPVTRFFVDTKAHDYKAIVVESGEAGVPPLVFIRQ